MAWAGLLLLTPATLAAVPVSTISIAGSADGSRLFGDHLSQVWQFRRSPAPEALALTVEPSPAQRVRAVSRGRADFAIVPADIAAALLPQNPGVTAVGILWPNTLHALTRVTSVGQRDPLQPVQAVSLSGNESTRISRDAAFLYRALLEAPQRGGEAMLAGSTAPEILAPLPRVDVTVFFAPVPAKQVRDILERNSWLRLGHFDPALVEELQVGHAWLRVAVLPLGAYPGMVAPIEVPANYQVLIAGPQAAPETVRKMLATVWDPPPSIRAVNPLFGQIDAELNAGFAPLFAFHPLSAERFGLEQGDNGEGGRE